MNGELEIWSLIGFACHLLAAVILTLGAGWILSKGDKGRPDRPAAITSMLITAVWCIVVSAFGPTSLIAQLSEIMRDLSWIYLTYRLFMIDGRHQSLKPIRPVIVALVFVELLQLAVLTIASQLEIPASAYIFIFQLSVMFRLLVAVGSLVLLHNLYVGASPAARPLLRWPASALAAMWAFELNLFTIAYLGGAAPIQLLALRGLVAIAAAILMIIGMRAGASSLRLSPSRAVAFQSLSLLVIGGYLLLMVGIAQAIASFGSDVGRLTQVGFTVAATALALLWLPSRKMRGWLRVTAIKHLFQHRYDYRAEWLRFTQTIGKSDDGKHSLQERVIKAVADITDSPGGLLFLTGDSGVLELASRWSWGQVEVPANPIPQSLAQIVEAKGYILDVDEVRSGIDRNGEAALLPDWVKNEPDAWAMVPLLHFDRLTGLVLLARPQIQRRLDWEDFDLLRVVGKQLASYLSEQAGQQALMEAARFDEFNRRIAFVMHDIKNLASQLALLARNAEKHADKPEFRDDMLVTLRSSANKLKTLLDRLNRYGSDKSEKIRPANLRDIAQTAIASFQDMHPVSLVQCEDAPVTTDDNRLVQALIHLIQNAIDASADDSPVYLNVIADGDHARLEVIDSGCGMSAEFLRDGLFKPFVSSKADGFGIGAFESRELIRGIGGQLDVESRKGIGTRFVVSFPQITSNSSDADGAEPSEVKVA